MVVSTLFLAAIVEPWLCRILEIDIIPSDGHRKLNVLAPLFLKNANVESANALGYPKNANVR